jgi:hypothetical protein
MLDENAKAFGVLAHYAFGMVTTGILTQVRYWDQNTTTNPPRRQTFRGLDRATGAEIDDLLGWGPPINDWKLSRSIQNRDFKSKGINAGKSDAQIRTHVGR